MAHLPAIMTYGRLLILHHHVCARPSSRRRHLLKLDPVFLIGKVGQLFQAALLVNDDRLEMFLLAVRAVRAEAMHVVHANVLSSHLDLCALQQMLGGKPALEALVAVATLVVRTRLAVLEKLGRHPVLLMIWVVSARLPRIVYVWHGVSVEALISFVAEALLLEVFANGPLLLYVLVQERACLPITARTCEPKGAHLQLMLRLVVPIIDGSMDLENLLHSFLLKVEGAMTHIIGSLLIACTVVVVVMASTAATSTSTVAVAASIVVVSLALVAAIVVVVIAPVAAVVMTVVTVPTMVIHPIVPHILLFCSQP